MIEQHESDGIVTLTLEHGKAAALDVELLEALQGELAAASEARAVILTGSGSIFSAGVDLFRMTDGGAEYVRRFFPLLRDTIRQLFAMPMPVVAAANGHAIAGGAIFVYASDIRLMAAGKGRIGTPELLVGLPFPVAALEIVRFAVPHDRLQHLIYSGRTLLPDEALAAGVIDEVVEPDALLARANEVAAQLAAVPRESFRLTKAELRAPALEAMRFGDVNDAQALAVWSDPAIHQHIREYLARTVRKS
jgi:enoyl-CoA hydratase